MFQRGIRVSAVFLNLILFALTAQAQKVGDKIVVISDKIEIKGRFDVTDTVHAGAIFVVREVQGERLGINSVHGTGFIEKRHVIPLARAATTY